MTRRTQRIAELRLKRDRIDAELCRLGAGPTAEIIPVTQEWQHEAHVTLGILAGAHVSSVVHKAPDMDDSPEKRAERRAVLEAVPWNRKAS